MAKHVCVAVLFCILAYVESTPFHPFGPPPYYGAPPHYAMAPAPCGYPMMPPPCFRFPFSCPPPNGLSPCQNRNNNNYGPQRPQQVDPGFSMSINWGDPSPQENPNSMKRHIIRPYNPYRRIRKNKGRRRRKFRGSRRKPYGRQPMPWQTNGGSYGGSNGGSYGGPYGRPTGSGWGRRLNDEGGFIPNDNSDPYNDDHGESPYRHDEPEDGNFDVGDDDDGGYEDDGGGYEDEEYDDDDGGHDNGIRHDEGESYDDDQGYDDGQRYDEGDDYDGDDDGDDY